jgi:hypothetical protein
MSKPRRHPGSVARAGALALTGLVATAGMSLANSTAAARAWAAALIVLPAPLAPTLIRIERAKAIRGSTRARVVFPVVGGPPTRIRTDRRSTPRFCANLPTQRTIRATLVSTDGVD